MRFGLSKKTKHDYYAGFNVDTDVPVFAAVVREFEYDLNQEEEEKHPYLERWRTVREGEKHTLFGDLKLMEATAQLLGNFALRTEEAVDDIPNYCAPHQDFQAVMNERADLGDQAERMAIILRTGLAKHIIFEPDNLADDFSSYLKLAAGE